MRVRVYTRPDNTVIIAKPDLRSRQPGETDDQTIDRQFALGERRHPERRLWPAADLDEAALPQDVRFRAAWRLMAGRVVVDLGAAKDQHRAFVARAVARETPIVTRALTRAMAKQDAAAIQALTATLQALDTATADPAIAAAPTVDAVRGLWPAVLGPSPYGRVEPVPDSEKERRR